MIYIKLTHSGKSVSWSTGHEIPTKHFSKGRCSPKFTTINKALLELRERVIDEDLKLPDRYKGRDRCRLIERRLQVQHHEPLKTIEWVLKYFGARKAINKDLQDSTRQNIQIRLNLCQKYSALKNLSSKLIPEFTVHHAREFYEYLRNKESYSHNYAYKVCCTFKEAMHIGIELGEINVNPFVKLNLREKVKPPMYLEQHQIKDVETMELHPHLDKCRDVFLLACYTGFGSSDLKKDLNRLIKSEGDFKYLELIRKKSRKDEPLTAWVPLTDKISFLLEKYGNRKIQFSDVVVNRQLKIIGKLLKVEGLSLKVGRNSFCNCNIANGYSVDVVATMMGHQSTRTTLRVYGKVRLNRVMLEHGRLLAV